MREGKEKADSGAISLSKQEEMKLEERKGQGTHKNRPFTHGNRRKGRRNKLQKWVELQP